MGTRRATFPAGAPPEVPLTYQLALMYHGAMNATTTTKPALDRRFHALSDENRLRVLECLRQGERCVCELTEELDVSQSLLSFHLKSLREAGLVRDRRQGRWIYYALDTEGLARLASYVEGLAAGGTSDGTGPSSCC